MLNSIQKIPIHIETPKDSAGAAFTSLKLLKNNNKLSIYDGTKSNSKNNNNINNNNNNNTSLKFIKTNNNKFASSTHNQLLVEESEFDNSKDKIAFSTLNQRHSSHNVQNLSPIKPTFIK